MKKLISRLALLGCGLLMLGQAHAGYTPTIDFWECANKVGGTFTHGRVPSGCDVASFGPDSFVRGNYGQAIFNDASYNTANANDPISVAERKRYMQQMYPIIRDASERYLKARKPAVLPDELAAYQRGVFALLRQESFWSHYRDAQLAAGQAFLLKMVRGDNGHGHGMMQLDDRYHLVPLQEGKGWNMLQNFSYAIDIYYDAWQKAPASCLGGATTGTGSQAQIDEYWRSRARSAWSAYNGGPTKVCRWQNASDVNVAKDNGYRDNYDLRRWLPDVTDLAKAATVDVACLMDMGSACPLPTSGGPLPNTLMKLGSAACVLVGETLECVDDLRDAACLGSRTSFDDSVATTVYAASVSGRTRVDHNRHQLCRAGTPGLQSLGSAINTGGPLELRSAVGGMLLGTLPAGNYQVLDYEVRGVLKQDRYYRVRGALTTGVQQDGWILAGDSASHAGIASAAAPLAAGAIAYPGDWVAVNVTTSLNLRASPPSGTVITTMPRGAVVQVKEVYGTASANNLYYRTEYLGKDGWFFAGNLYPTSTLASWAVPAAAPAAPTKHAHCPTGTRYDIHSRQCMSASSVYGPFTATATQACLDSGAGAVCTVGRGVVVDGALLQLQLWNKATNTAAIGNGDCPRGASRSVAHRFHCAEAVVRNGVAETDVYGPFGTTLVNACLAANGNAAFCRSNRWPGSAYTALQP